MFDTNDSCSDREIANVVGGEDQWTPVDADGFAPEYPFPDVELGEVLVDDPWFADIDASRDGGSDAQGDAGAGADVEGDADGFAPECPFEDDGEPGAPVGVRSVGDELSDLLARRPDAYVVVRLAGIDARSLSPEDAIVCLQVAQRTEAWQAALAVHAYVAAGSGHARVEEVQAFDPHPDSDEQITIRIEDAIREEISTALRLSGQAAHERLVTSRLLAGPMTTTLAALESGSITASHARVVTDAAKRLPGWIASIGPDAESLRPVDVAERVEFTRACGLLQDRVVPVAARGTLAHTRAAASRAVLAIDADGAARRRAQVRKTRDAFVLPGDDGHSLFAVRLLTEHAYACLARVDALAHDDRLITDCDASIGERRAEAAYALLLATAASIDPASSTAPNHPVDLEVGGHIRPRNPRQPQGRGVPRPRLRAHLDITIDLPTLLSLRAALTDPTTSAALADGAHRASASGGGVAEIAGIGPVGADVVRGLLADPDVAVTMRRLVTDPLTGHLLDYGRKTYQVPGRLRDFITARDKTCRFPGCRRKAANCQVDHADAWSDGGDTSRSNTGALCVRHHQLKTHGGWTITDSHADGSCTWTSPQGREHEHQPEPIHPPPPVPEPEVPPF